MNKWIYIGYFAFTLSLGFIIGASNSPVIGAFLSSLFGILIALLSARSDASAKGFFLNKSELTNLGKLLFGFSIFLIVGLLIGESYRTGRFSTKSRNFIWSGKTMPTSTYEALDWIILEEKLSKLGYSRDKIAELYDIRITERIKLDSISIIEAEEGVESFNRTEIYDKSNPFNKFIDTETLNKLTPSRGPASE